MGEANAPLVSAAELVAYETVAALHPDHAAARVILVLIAEVRRLHAEQAMLWALADAVRAYVVEASRAPANRQDAAIDAASDAMVAALWAIPTPAQSAPPHRAAAPA